MLLPNVLIFGSLGFFLILNLWYLQNAEVDPYVIRTVNKLMYIPDIDVISAARNYHSYYSIYVNRIKLIIKDIEKSLSSDENLHDNIGFIEVIIPSIDKAEKKLCQILSDRGVLINRYIKDTDRKLLQEKIYTFAFVKFWEDKNCITIASNLERFRELLLSHLTLISN